MNKSAQTSASAARPPNAQRAQHARGPVRLGRWQLLGVYVSFGMLAASGLVWLGLHGAAMLAAASSGDALPSPAKAWALRVHAGAALAALVALGSLLPLHVRSAWYQHKNRLSGTLNLIVMAVLTLTGYALWYASEGSFKQWSAWLHWGIGLAMPAVLAAHVVFGRRVRRRAGG